MKTPLLLTAMLVALAACSDPVSQEAAKVPSVVTPSATTSPQAPESNYDKALRFTRCMNDTLEATYPEYASRARKVPDPVEGQYLQTYVTIPREAFKGSAVGTWIGDGSGGWQVSVPDIFNKCKHLLPPIWPVKEDPDDTRRFGKFYECLRKRGIDVPKADANGIIHMNPNPEIRETDEYRAAEAACRHLADDPAVKSGGDR